MKTKQLEKKEVKKAVKKGRTDLREVVTATSGAVRTLITPDNQASIQDVRCSRCNKLFTYNAAITKVQDATVGDECFRATSEVAKTLPKGKSLAEAARESYLTFVRKRTLEGMAKRISAKN